MKIQSLLNPSVSDRSTTKEGPGSRSSPTDTPVATPCAYSPPIPVLRRDKVPKDAPVYIKGKPKGEVRYPAYENSDEESLLRELRKYQVFPLGEIGEHVRHIPYNSDKKDFSAKTGREGFEAFQYSFKIPGESKEHHAMWDYNIGLVRMTAWFKCLKYPKTTPAKVLSLNPGLRDISHSITGGALSAQGYWMPFDAAKAVAATFCWDIRHLLVPMFGKDFLEMCIPPDSPSFADFKISQEIVHACTKETRSWLRMSKDVVNYTTPRSTPLMRPVSPTTIPHNYVLPAWQTRVLRPRVGPITPEIESDYYTDADENEMYRCSPEISPTSQSWATINRNRSPRTCVSSLQLLCSPTPGLSSVPKDLQFEHLTMPKRTHAEMEDGRAQKQSASPTPGYATPAKSARSEPQASVCRAQDLRAAYLLMQLSVTGRPAKRMRTLSV